MKCPFCQMENESRNYYCKWCEKPLKDTDGSRKKKFGERHNYLLTLDVVEDNSNDKDFFGVYKSHSKV